MLTNGCNKCENTMDLQCFLPCYKVVNNLLQSYKGVMYVIMNYIVVRRIDNIHI